MTKFPLNVVLMTMLMICACSSNTCFADTNVAGEASSQIVSATANPNDSGSTVKGSKLLISTVSLSQAADWHFVRQEKSIGEKLLPCAQGLALLMVSLFYFVPRLFPARTTS